MTQRRAATVAMAGLALGILAQYLFVKQIPGLNVVLATGAFVGMAWTLRDRTRILRPADLWPPVFALVFAALCALRADVALITFDTLAALGLAAATLAVLRGARVTDLPLPALLAEAGETGAALLGRARSAFALGWPVLRALSRTRRSRAAGYAGGALLATPFLIVFAALFASADAVFDRALADAFDLASLRELVAELPWRVTVALVVAWLATGALAWLAVPAAERDDRGVAPFGAADVITGMLVAIDVLFAVFVVFQVAYLFGGRDTVAAVGISYSTYARRGFFELVAVVALVGGLLFVADLAARDRGRAYHAAAVALLALSGVVLASAAMRMDLYQRAYGWTELRFYACVGIAYLAIVLMLLAWAIARGRMAVALQRIVMAAICVALAANGIGPSALVARSNIDRFLSSEPLPEGAYRDIDLAYLVSLGDGAMPTLFDRLSSLPPPERGKLEALLSITARRRNVPAGWQSWNLERARAGELLSR